MNNTKEDQRKLKLASFWHHKFNEALSTKEKHVKNWDKYWEAYKGDYFKNVKLPPYRSSMVANYIFSVIETVRPIMLDNDPKFVVMPRKTEGLMDSHVIQTALSYEWDRERMSLKVSSELINVLVTGTSIGFIPYDSDEGEVRGNFINPYNFYPSPLATTIEDADYHIYATYKHVEELKRQFPEHADKLYGSDVKHTELVTPDFDMGVDNQVLVLEIWTKGLETDKEIYGEDLSTKKKTSKNKVITVAPDFSLVLDEKENPYGSYPFVLIKNYDVPNEFWGLSEVTMLLSPQENMNMLSNAVIDNARSTANSPWVVDENAGIPKGSITAEPGLVIRKRPGSEVRRQEPGQMPHYVINQIDTIKRDFEEISGIYRSSKGGGETGVYTASGIMALQEASQTRVRMKVKLLEYSLGLMGEKWLDRMRQYWKVGRWIRVIGNDGEVDIQRITKRHLAPDYDIRVSAGSTMPSNRGTMLDMMIRLAQTPMPDGMPLVDRDAVAEYLPPEIKSTMLKRMKDQEQNSVQMLQQMQQQFQEGMEQMGQQLQQVGQQLEEVAQQSQQNDEQAFEIIEEITNSLEEVNKKIEKLEGEYSQIKREKEDQDRVNKIQSKAYDSGYNDAEKSFSQPQEDPMSNKTPVMPGGLEPTGIDDLPGLEDQPSLDDLGTPDEIVSLLSNASDEELSMLLEQYPGLDEFLE